MLCILIDCIILIYRHTKTGGNCYMLHLSADNNVRRICPLIVMLLSYYYSKL